MRRHPPGWGPGYGAPDRPLDPARDGSTAIQGLLDLKSGYSETPGAQPYSKDAEDTSIAAIKSAYLELGFTNTSSALARSSIKRYAAADGDPTHYQIRRLTADGTPRSGSGSALTHMHHPSIPVISPPLVFQAPRRPADTAVHPLLAGGSFAAAAAAASATPSQTRQPGGADFMGAVSGYLGPAQLPGAGEGYEPQCSPVEGVDTDEYLRYGSRVCSGSEPSSAHGFQLRGITPPSITGTVFALSSEPCWDRPSLNKHMLNLSR